MAPKRTRLSIFEYELDSSVLGEDTTTIYKTDPEDNEYELVVNVSRRKKCDAMIPRKRQASSTIGPRRSKRTAFSHVEIPAGVKDRLSFTELPQELSQITVGSPIEDNDTRSTASSSPSSALFGDTGSNKGSVESITTATPAGASDTDEIQFVTKPRLTNQRRQTPVKPPDESIARSRPTRNLRPVRYSQLPTLEISDESEQSDEEMLSASNEAQDDNASVYDMGEDDESIDEDSASQIDELEESEEETHDEDDDDAVPTKSKGAKDQGSKSVQKKQEGLIPLKVQSSNAIDDSLEPMSDIYDIFRDMTAKAVKHGLDKLSSNMKKPLRVLTLCSGTEAPLLALQMVQQALVDLKMDPFSFEHCASAEKEPFKQAYIERNFHPEIIYRDVEELIRDEAETQGAFTVYGAMAPIPRDIDMIVAGTSCKDFSNLNNQKKELKDNGESGITFRALLKVASYIRPKLVVQENVANAPWKEMQKAWDMINYDTAYLKLDTKNYYLPHTRTRGYMVCIDRTAGKLKNPLTRWQSLVQTFERKASAPVSAFLLPSDDPRVQLQRAMNAKQSRDEVQERKPTPWVKCEARHERVRAHYGLGQSKCFTGWDRNGTCLVPEYADGVWHNKQTERVKDLIDVAHLRNMLDERGAYDSGFKQRIWQLKDNVDYGNDHHPFGIAPCICPTGIPYVTNRGDLLIGYETLMLQGIPLDRISFTTESNKDIMDLAGNAMTTTVVGAAMLAALIVGTPLLVTSTGGSSKTIKKQPRKVVEVKNMLEPREISLDLGPEINIHELLEDAERSSRFCVCEARTEIAKSLIRRCSECFHTSCGKCGRKPKHVYRSLENLQRKSAQDFEHTWRSRLPIALQFNSRPDLEELKMLWAQSTDASVWTEYLEAVETAFTQEYHLRQFNRSRAWTIVYDSPTARLELVLSKHQPHWRLFVKADSSLPGKHPLRKTFANPVARSSISENLFTGSWQLYCAVKQTADIKICPCLPMVPSWRAEIGLVDYQNEQVPQRLEIEIDKNNSGCIEDVSGIYTLLPKCGTACRSLYKRVTGGGEDSEALYLFLDPKATGDPAHDEFVFSYNHERIESLDSREVVLRLACGWRPWNMKKPANPQIVKASANGFWTDAVGASITLSACNITATVRKPEENLLPERWPTVTSCSQSVAVFECRFPLSKDLAAYWRDQSRLDSSRRFLSSFSWLTVPTGNIPLLKTWRPLKNIASLRCDTCAPAKPNVEWQRVAGKGRGNTTIFQENHLKASEYERHLKERPPIFEVESCVEEHDIGRFSIAINIISLAHKALGKLDLLDDLVSLAWNLSTHYKSPPSFNFPQFTLQDNTRDPECTKDLKMAYSLRPDQKRSLTWMQAQEAVSQPNFELQEIEEELLPEVEWKVEAKATRPICIKGGVLADDVGYGKTVTSLALIHSEFQELSLPKIVKRNLGQDQPRTGLLDIGATIIMTHKSLIPQWRSEIRKFLGEKGYDQTQVFSLPTFNEYRKMTIKQFQEAKIIIIDWKLFVHPEVNDLLARFAAVPNAPNKPSQTCNRAFSAWFDHAVDQLPDAIERLKELGPQGFQKDNGLRLQKNRTKPEFQREVPSELMLSTASSKKKQAQATGSKSGDWTMFSAPPIHMFRFNRMIVDEFSFLVGDNVPIYGAITRLQAHKRWILSATPAMEDFADVKKMASFLGINLGVDNDTPGVLTARNSRRLRLELTASEKFQAYCVSKSHAWHMHRHQHAQRFLDVFVRQNPTEFLDIETRHHLKPVKLAPGDRALYTELSTYLISKDMEPKRIESKSDRSDHINNYLAGQPSPEHALLQCSTSVKGSRVHHVDIGALATRRQEELDALTLRLRKSIAKAEALYGAHGDAGGYGQWRSNILKYNQSEDANALEIIQRTLETNDSHRPTAASSGDATKRLPGLTTDIRRMCADMVDVVRSTRFATAIAGLNENGVVCQGSNHDSHGDVSDGSLVVLSMCGHVSCAGCLNNLGDGDFCVSDGCKIRVQPFHAVRATDLPDGRSRSHDLHGAKLDDLSSLLQGIPADDQAIIFVQDFDMMNAVCAALEEDGISIHAVKENSDAQEIENFKREQGKKDGMKALLLNLSNEFASGLNLPNANHVIFLAPLLAETQYKYEAAMKQSIGRARRWGQKKTVHVYHFVALRTIDVDILEQRHRLSYALHTLDSPSEHLKPGPGSREGSADEQVKLVELVGPSNKQEYALLPRSWIEDPKRANAAGLEFDLNSGFSTLTHFSGAFIEDAM